MTDLPIDDLPTEILVSVLSTLDTKDLINLTTVSKRFHYVVLRVLYTRILLAAEIPEHKIILEAYHPSRRYTDPYISCTYHDTPGLDCLESESDSQLPEHLAQLDSIYSRFRPEQPLVHGPLPARRIINGHAAPVPGTNFSLEDPATIPPEIDLSELPDAKVTRNLNLDEDELFGQFCAYASLVKPGQRPGLFSSTVPIVENGKGVMRVWRQWLQDRVTETEQTAGYRPGSPTNDSNTSLVSTNEITKDHYKSSNILWTDNRHNVGLKVRIQHNMALPTPNPFQPPPSHTMPENHPSLFTIEIQELIVRTTHLLMGLEDLVKDESKGLCGDKALIFVSRANKSLIASSSLLSSSSPLRTTTTTTSHPTINPTSPLMTSRTPLITSAWSTKEDMIVADSYFPQVHASNWGPQAHIRV